MDNQEQITRMVKSFGNGAHVFVPKDWAGKQIQIIKPAKKSLREKILLELDPYLDSIEGVYLYGSNARGEQVSDSDIDLFVITNDKIKIKSEGFEILCLKQEDIKKAVKVEPLLMYSIFSECQTIINSKLIGNIKANYEPKIKDFKSFLEDSQRMIKVSEEFLQSEKSDYVSGEAVIYSIVLRLRGLFIIHSLLNDKKYSTELFKKWVKGNLSQMDFDLIYGAYRSSKNEKKFKQKIKVKDIVLLLNFLNKEIVKLVNG